MICIRSGWTSWKRWSFSHWRALTRYVDDGLLEINKSAAERALRAVSIGRKNYLFFGADSGGERAASFYSLIGTAKLNGTDPSFYLRTVLARIAEHPIICFDQLCDLLSLEIITERQRSLRWRLARFEKAGLVTRLQGQTHLRTPVFGITQQGLIFLESRGHYLLSLPSGTEAILHPSQIPHALEMVSIRVAFAKAGVLHSWKSDLEIASRNLVLENERSSKGFRRRCRDRGRRKEAHDRHRIRAEPKSCRRYHAIREVFERDETTDAVLYLTANDDILYLLAMELRAMRKRIGFVLSDAFRRSLLETRTLTNSNKSEVVLLRDFLCGNKT